MTTTVLPWKVPPLDKWAICGMNHYRENGEEKLFVCMSRSGRCIKAEGYDDLSIWTDLSYQAKGQP